MLSRTLSGKARFGPTLFVSAKCQPSQQDHNRQCKERQFCNLRLIQHKSKSLCIGHLISYILFMTRASSVLAKLADLPSRAEELACPKMSCVQGLI